MPELIETVACGGAAKWQDYVAAWCARKFNELSCSLVFSWMPVGSAGDGPYGACCLMFFSSIAVGGQSTCRRSTSAFVAAKVRSTRGFCCAAHAASGVPRHRSCGDADPCRAGKASCRAALASACRVSIYRSAPRELRQPAAHAALFVSGNRLYFLLDFSLNDASASERDGCVFALAPTLLAVSAVAGARGPQPAHAFF